MTEAPIADFCGLAQMCDSFSSIPESQQHFLLTCLFSFFDSDWDEQGVPNPEILTALARILANASFSECSIDLSRTYERFLLIIETDEFSAMIPTAVVILSAIARRSPSLRSDPAFQTSVARVLQQRPSFDFTRLCKALICSAPFPSPDLLHCLHDYIDPFLHIPGHPSFAGALQFVTLSLKNQLPLQFSDFFSQILNALEKGSCRAIDAALDFLSTSGCCTNQICDIVLERLPSSAAELSVRAAHLFLLAQNDLLSRADRIMEFFLSLVRHSDYAVRTAGILCFLGYLTDVRFSCELCELLLEFYDLPAASPRIFQIFLGWIEEAGEEDLMAFANLIGGRL
jgi:hypothetical protein